MDASRCVGRQTITTGTGDECTLNMQAVLHHKAHPSFKHAWREQTRIGSKTMTNATTGRRNKGVGWKVIHHDVSMWQGLHVCAYTDAACSFLQTPSNPPLGKPFLRTPWGCAGRRGFSGTNACREPTSLCRFQSLQPTMLPHGLHEGKGTILKILHHLNVT